MKIGVIGLKFTATNFIIAQENGDSEAWHFFIQEFVKEKARLRNEHEKKPKELP